MSKNQMVAEVRPQATRAARFGLVVALWVGSAAAGIIPHGGMAVLGGTGVVRAWFDCPTSRYAHGVLGDSIEAGCLVVESATGSSARVDLNEHQVFEDLTPRLADIDGNGSNDVVVIRSDADAGAALVVYSLVEGKLTEVAATPPIGRSFRWLAPVGIADFNDDGRLDIAYVETPHIGGILRVWSHSESGVFEEIATLSGFSNHSIGSTRISTSRLLDHNNDGVMDMALPDQSRTNTHVVSLLPEPAIIDTFAYDEAWFDAR